MPPPCSAVKISATLPLPTYPPPFLSMVYVQRRDNDGFAVRSKRVFRLRCCDCGLVHDVVAVSARGWVGK
jgi:hypothetical protein